MSDTARIRIHMSADEVARLDEIRGEGTSRSAFVRELIRRAGPLPFGRDAATSLFARRGSERLMPQGRDQGRLPTSRWATVARASGGQRRRGLPPAQLAPTGRGGAMRQWASR